MSIDRDTMVRLIRNEIPEGEASALHRAIEADASLTEVYRRTRRTLGVLSEGAAESFGPYFSERVMKRLLEVSPIRRSTFYDSLQWVFLRLAAASLLIVVGLGAYNALDARDSDLATSTVEAVFGLPSADIDNLFYFQGI